MTEQQNLEEKNEQALTPQPSIAVPEVAGQNALGRGHEEPLDLDEIEIPRAKLIQFTSEENQETGEDHVDAGTLINSITKEKLGSFFIPIFKFTSFIRWNPKKKNDPNFDPAYKAGSMIFTTTDRQDPRVVNGIKFGAGGEPPQVTRYINFLCYFPAHSCPLILSFAKTSFHAGKKLNSLTRFSGGDMFKKMYKLSIKMEDAEGTKYFVFDVAPAGVAKEEDFKLAEAWFNEFRGKNLKVHGEEEVAETSAPAEAWPE